MKNQYSGKSVIGNINHFALKYFLNTSIVVIGFLTPIPSPPNTTIPLFQVLSCSANNHYSYKQHTTHTWINRPTHIYKYTLAPPAMCSRQRSVLHCMSNSEIYKVYIIGKCVQCLCFSKITSKSYKSADQIRQTQLSWETQKF